jgi:hypothetical protein
VKRDKLDKITDMAATEARAYYPNPGMTPEHFIVRDVRKGKQEAFRVGFMAGYRIAENAAQRAARKAKPRPASPLPPTSIVVIGGGGGGTGKSIKFKGVGKWKPLPNPTRNTRSKK